MVQLRDRVMKLREEYDQIYNMSRTEGKPSFNWGSMIDEKLVWKSEAFLTTVCIDIVNKTAMNHVWFGLEENRLGQQEKHCRHYKTLAVVYTESLIAFIDKGNLNMSSPSLQFSLHFCRTLIRLLELSI